MSIEYQIIILAVLILAYPIINWILLNVYVTYDLRFDKDFIKHGYLSRKHLSDLSKDNFNDWCVNFLAQIGYKTPMRVTHSSKLERNIFCKSEKLETYVVCNPLGLKDKPTTEDDYHTVGRPDVQRLVGEMVHDSVQNGIIITTGDFTEDAREFVKSLPENLKIRLIDGIELSSLYRSKSRL